MRKPVITVFGSSSVAPSDEQFLLAHDLGRAIAAAGWTLCNGGYGGTMAAAARGAREMGGHTIGVTCTVFGRNGPNEWIVEEVPTSDLLARLHKLIALGDAYVALPGGTGTLLELALVWELSNKGLQRPPRPIVLLGDFWQPIVPVVRRAQPDAQPLASAADAAGVVAALRTRL
jgi:uncharacterized protein (TIGR00730 family)